MDEMTAFERQMAGSLSHMGGAGRRIGGDLGGIVMQLGQGPIPFTDFGPRGQSELKVFDPGVEAFDANHRAGFGGHLIEGGQERLRVLPPGQSGQKTRFGVHAAFPPVLRGGSTSGRGAK